MRVRSTEIKHQFTQRLYDNLNAFHLEGLTMDSNRNFTAAIEAVEFEANEQVNIANIFSEEDLRAKYLLATTLQIPLYIISHKNEEFRVFRVSQNERLNFLFLEEQVLDNNGFVRWWAQIKRTNQPHPLLNGGQFRAARTRFDALIEGTGQAWGGNVDGFVVRNNRIVAIIDNISINFTYINNEWADPARFFHKKGPKYTTWLSTVKLANQLDVPHILLTINGNNPTEEVVGLTVIENLDTKGVYYKNNITPPNNILRGMQSILAEINSNIQNSQPPQYI